jgi:hypothetical protein
MINYFKYTSGNAFTLSGQDYSGFVNIEDSIPYTGRVKNSFSKELSSKDNFLARSIIDKREFDNSPSALTTNKINNLEYSPRNILSNDFLKKNFNILYENNLSLFSLGQVYSSSYFNSSNFKDEQTLGGFFGLSSTTIDDRNDDRNLLKDLTTPYQIDPFEGADKNIFPELYELDNTKKSYIETFEDGFIYTITTDSKTIAFSGCFNGQLEKISNETVQNELASVKKLDVDKANGLIYSPMLEEDGFNYTNIYDRDIFRACTRLKIIDKIKTSASIVINNNISFGKNYKVVQVLDSEYNINLEISPNTTSEVLATIPVSTFNNPEYVKVNSRYTDNLLLIVTKPVSNTLDYNIYFLDIEQYLIDKIIPEPTTIKRVVIGEKYNQNTTKNTPVTVFGSAGEGTGYYYPLFCEENAAKELGLGSPLEISFPQYPDKIFYIATTANKTLINFNLPEDRPDGYFIYRDDDSIIDIDVEFSDYDSNLFTIKDNGNLTERMITDPIPITSFVESDINLQLPPDILFTSAYKFNTNKWKFNTNSLKSNQLNLINNFTDTFKDKTYSYYHNIGRIYFSSDITNKKRISLVPGDLKSSFNPDIFDTICETGLGINLNVLIQDILRDTINIYNNFTRIPKADELKNYYINERKVSLEEYQKFQKLSREEQLNKYGIRVIRDDIEDPSSSIRAPELSVTSSTKTVPSTLEASKPAVSQPRLGKTYWGFVASIDSPSAILLPNQYGVNYEYGNFSRNSGFGFDELDASKILNTPVLNQNQKFYITVSDYPTARRGFNPAPIGFGGGETRNIEIDAKDLFPFPGDLEKTEYGRIEVNAEELQEFLNGNFPGQKLPNGTQGNPFDRTQRFNDLRERVGPTYYYINEQQVSRLEYEAFQNLSQEEQLNRYGVPKPQVDISAQPDNRTVSSRVENTDVKVFNDYKIPTPIEIDTRNFYFHSNESVNYLSVNRVFSKLFELQKTIYDSILSS